MQIYLGHVTTKVGGAIEDTEVWMHDNF